MSDSRHMKPARIAYLTASAGDWGGASRVLFTNLKLLDKSRYHPVVLLPGKGPVLPALDEMGVEYTLWGKPKEPESIVRYLFDIFRSIIHFRKLRISILHINHANYWRPAEIIAAKILRIPVITHYHVVVHEPGPYVKYSDVIVSVSDFVSQHSLPQNITYKTIHNAVDPDRFSNGSDLRDALKIPKRNVVFAFVGQIREIKGIDVFIQAAQRVKCPNATFIIAGRLRDVTKFDGAYTMERLEKEINGDQRIQYIGYRSDIENVYKTADVIVVPSSWDEPFGLINIEAGAAGKPIIATRSGGIPEIIEHGYNGYLFEKQDISGLAVYMEKLAMSREKVDEMGGNARKVVNERFVNAPISKLQKLYDDLGS